MSFSKIKKVDSIELNQQTNMKTKIYRKLVDTMRIRPHTPDQILKLIISIQSQGDYEIKEGKNTFFILNRLYYMAQKAFNDRNHLNDEIQQVNYLAVIEYLNYRDDIYNTYRTLNYLEDIADQIKIFEFNEETDKYIDDIYERILDKNNLDRCSLEVKKMKEKYPSC